MNTENTEFEQWLIQQPKDIQELAKKYPPGRYKIKDGCPYMISRPGTIVEISGYQEDGDILIIVRAADKLPIAIAHEKKIAADHGMSEEKIKEVNESDYEGQIEPEYLEPIEQNVEN